MRSHRAVCTLVMVILATSALVVGITPSESEADADQFAVICIVNKTDIPINYWFKWGSNRYELETIRSGYRQWHSWNYSVGSHSSPTFHIMFDYDLRDGNTTYKYYTLERYRNQFQDCDGAKKYRFERIREFIDLYSVE